MTGEELQRHQEIVAAMVKHINAMTREELIDMLAWRPEGYQEENAISAPAGNHATANGHHPYKTTTRKPRRTEAA